MWYIHWWKVGGKAVLFELKEWGVMLNFVPYVWELVLSQVSIE